MNCSKHRLSLYTYRKENMKSFEKEAIAQHLEECTSCQNELRDVNVTRELFSQSLSNIKMPSDLKLDIMESINLNKYKSTNKIKNLAFAGASMVAAGILLMVINYGAFTNGVLFKSAAIAESPVQSNIAEGFDNVKAVVSRPIELFNKGVADISTSIVNLDGITARMKSNIDGGM